MFKHRKNVFKMNKKSKKKIFIICSIVFIVVIIGILIFFVIKNKNNPSSNPIEVLDTISSYGYNLEDRDTSYYKETFMHLKEILESDELNYEEYAKYLSILFLTDFYTLDNKISKYDVGSLDFIYPEEKEKFQNKAMDTLYKLILDNSTNTRKQELPIVKKVEIESIEDTTYQKNNDSLEGYLITATIQYEKDLGYDENVKLTLTKENNKLFIVKLEANNQ